MAITFLAMGISLHEGALFRVDFLYKRFSVPGPALPGFPLQRPYRSDLSFWWIIQIFRLLVSSIERGMAAPTLLGTPLYLPQLIMPVGMTFIVLLLLVDTGRKFQRLVGGRSRGGYKVMTWQWEFILVFGGFVGLMVGGLYVPLAIGISRSHLPVHS